MDGTDGIEFLYKLHAHIEIESIREISSVRSVDNKKPFLCIDFKKTYGNGTILHTTERFGCQNRVLVCSWSISDQFRRF